MNITQNQIKALKGKCPECRVKDRVICICQCTGQATTEIEKEWVECPKCNGSGEYRERVMGVDSDCVYQCNKCNGNGKIQKYNVGQTLYQRTKGIGELELLTTEEFELLLSAWDYKEEQNEIAKDFIKLKIISETENEWRVCLA